MALAFGGLLIWAGFARANIFDILRTSIGAPVAPRTPAGALYKPPIATSA